MLLVAAGTVLIVSCGKKPDAIGLDLVDDEKPFVGTDTTLQIIAWSVPEDSVVSDETTVNVIGSMQTSTFGRATASCYLHLRISDPTPEWGPNPVADSVLFYMEYDTAYGNVSTQQTFTIYRVTEDFYRDSTYYSNRELAWDAGQVFGQYTFVPDLTPQLVVDSTDEGVDTSYLSAQLKFPMDLSFADFIFGLDTSVMASNENFINEVKGIYILPDEVQAAGQGALLSFDLVSERSYIEIFYHNDTTDSLSYRFLININSARVGRFTHRYELSTDPVFTEKVLNRDTAGGETALYLQGLGGIMMNLDFSALNSWPEADRVVVNEARLIFESNPYDEAFPPPDRLYLFKYNESGQLETVSDQAEGDDYFGGYFNTSNRQYWFRLTQEVQKLINGQENYGYIIVPRAKSILPHEVVMPGTGAGIQGRFKLAVTYTLVN
ncbi:MAG: hypothetical protein Kow00127_05090 [Bacteroidales bacterium]